MLAPLTILALAAALVGVAAFRWDEVQRVARGETVYLESGWVAMPARLPKFLQAERGQLGFQTVLAGLVVVIAVSLGVVVVDKFDQSLGTPNDSNLSSAQDSILSGFSDMAALIGPLLLVAIAVVIINLLRSTR